MHVKIRVAIVNFKSLLLSRQIYSCVTRGIATIWPHDKQQYSFLHRTKDITWSTIFLPEFWHRQMLSLILYSTETDISYMLSLINKRKSKEYEKAYTTKTWPPHPLKQSRSTDDSNAWEIVSNNSSGSWIANTMH